MRAAKAKYDADMRNIAKARKILNSGPGRAAGAFGYGTKEYHDAEALENQIIQGIAKGYGGVVTDSDRESARKEFPSLTRIGKGGLTRLDAAERKLKNMWQAQVSAKIKGKKSTVTVKK